MHRCNRACDDLLQWIRPALALRIRSSVEHCVERLLGRGEPRRQAAKMIGFQWLPMVVYRCQPHPGKNFWRHAALLDSSGHITCSLRNTPSDTRSTASAMLAVIG